MAALFVTLGIAIITLLAILLWFVPHLLHQQAISNATESARLRDMLLDILSEQEAVATRQSELSASLAYFQEQLESVLNATQQEGHQEQVAVANPDTLRQLEERISAMQLQIQHWLDTRARVQRYVQAQDNEAWAHLMSLLSAIQERLGQLSADRAVSSSGPQVRILVDELEQELEHLRTIVSDVAKLRWRLQRSLGGREGSAAGFRIQAGGSAD
ncbi:MAG: hypothetical protein RMK84_17155 [Oscillochloridaceae bacterium]|nr:hypothetical protein [Chloroflexaceae bacterium]MDW8391852.1 hypothetical protein [Oscillochloridaceae bacterium]